MNAIETLPITQKKQSRIKYQFKSVAKISLCYSTLIYTKTDSIRVRASIKLTSNHEFKKNVRRLRRLTIISVDEF